MKYRFIHKNYITDDQLCKVYCKLQQEQAGESVFCSAPVSCREWIQQIREDKWFVLVQDESGADIGAFWLDGFRERSAFIHVFSLDASDGRAYFAARAGLEWLAENIGYRVSVLMSFAPVINTQVIRFQKLLGFHNPYYLQDAIELKSGDFCDAVIMKYKLTGREENV